MMDYRENAGYVITDSSPCGRKRVCAGGSFDSAPSSLSPGNAKTGRIITGATISAACLKRRKISFCGRRRRFNIWSSAALTQQDGAGTRRFPLGEIQTCHTLCPRAYSVSTAGHGGVMVSGSLQTRCFARKPKIAALWSAATFALRRTAPRRWHCGS